MENKCPLFKDDDYEPILNWGKVVVEYFDSCDPLLPQWRINWKFQVDGRTHFIIHPLAVHLKEQEPQARRKAALFVYLFCKDVESQLAWELVKRYK